MSLPFITIVQKEWRYDLNGDLIFSGASSHVADFLWITPPTPSDRKRPRIGVIFKGKEESEGLVIERVLPGSPAEKADLLPGDQLVTVEGKEIKQARDIHQVLDERGWGKEVTFTILRNGETKVVTVTLPPSID